MTASITAQEIKDIRGKYGLTQKSFAQLLGIGTASMARYEHGAEPSKANANLIRAARYPEFMRECLQRDGGLIPQAQREKASRVIYAAVSLDPVDSAEAEKAAQSNSPRWSKMDEVYHYTIQQEVLNEQAANLVGEMISIKITAGFSGAASDVFDKLLDQLARLKPTIVSEESMSDDKLASIRGYLKCADDLVRRQLNEVA